MKRDGVVTDLDLVKFGDPPRKRWSMWEICRRGVMRVLFFAGGSLLAGVGFARGILGRKTDVSFLWISMMLIGVGIVLYAFKPRGGD